MEFFYKQYIYQHNGEIRRWTIPYDMVIRGDVDMSNMGLKELPDLSAVTVTGNFNCSGNQLTSLKGAPKSVGGWFNCCDNNLTSLEGATQSVGGDFICLRNILLKSLAGFKSEIGGLFMCGSERLQQEYEEIKKARLAEQMKNNMLSQAMIHSK